MKNVADYSLYECPFSHIEKECGHELNGPEGCEEASGIKTWGVWCPCGFRGPALILEPEKLGLRRKGESAELEQLKQGRGEPVADNSPEALQSKTLKYLLKSFADKYEEGAEPATDENLMRKTCRDALAHIESLQNVANCSAEVIGGYFMKNAPPAPAAVPLEEARNIALNAPVFPGNTISHKTAYQCEEMGWAKRDENGNWVPTESNPFYGLSAKPAAVPVTVGHWDNMVLGAAGEADLLLESNETAIIEFGRCLRKALLAAPSPAETNPAAVPADYAGTTIWIGDRTITRVVSKEMIEHEMESGIAITQAAQDCLNALASTPQQKTQPTRQAPWPDYAGNTIKEGDRIGHPSGQKGRVYYMQTEDVVDAWRVDYDDGADSPLALQIGDKGRAVVLE